MTILLISPEGNFDREIEILLDLCDMGLDVFHLRKPNFNRDQYKSYLNALPKQYHTKMVLHNYHELHNEYSIKGLHFSEKKRLEMSEGDWDQYKGLDLTLSSSFHNLQDVETCKVNFDYHFLSPVFDSISKLNYSGKGFDVSGSSKRIFGLGGVEADNLEKLKGLGYSGAALLGAVWNSKNPVKSFESCLQEIELK